MLELVLNILIACVIGLAIKRAIFGPQKTFARVSSALTVTGGLGVWLVAPDKGSVGMHLSAIALCSGLSILVLMFAVENWWMVKQLVAKSHRD